MQCLPSIHVHDFGGKFMYLCFLNNHGSFNLIITKTNHISFTLKKDTINSDIYSSVTLKTLLSFMLHQCSI